MLFQNEKDYENCRRVAISVLQRLVTVNPPDNINLIFAILAQSKWINAESGQGSSKEG